MSGGILMATTAGTHQGVRRLFAMRFSGSIVLLIAGFFCLQPYVIDHVAIELGNWLIFGFSWLLPSVAFLISLYQLIRYRSLQHAVEIALAVWLLIRAFSLIVKAG